MQQSVFSWDPLFKKKGSTSKWIGLYVSVNSVSTAITAIVLIFLSNIFSFQSLVPKAGAIPNHMEPMGF